MLLVTLYPQFHPNKALEVRAVVDAKRTTPVRMVAIDMAPLRPMRGSSTAHAAINAPGMPHYTSHRDVPISAMMTVLRYVIPMDVSPVCAPRVARKYGKKALYKGNANPINPHRRMVKLVENASFRV
jgi:hypothetical protein